MKKPLIILSYILLLVGFVGWVGGALIGMGFLNYNKEVPLGDIQGFVVDSAENVYVGLGFYGKIQAYDKNGNFLRNWSAHASGGVFNIEITKEQNIRVSTARGDKQVTFDSKGNELTNTTIEGVYGQTERQWDIFMNDTGDKYEVTGGMFPKIVKSSSAQRVIVRQGILLQMIKGPFPVWLIAAMGMGLNFLLRREELMKKMKKYSA